MKCRHHLWFCFINLLFLLVATTTNTEESVQSTTELEEDTDSELDVGSELNAEVDTDDSEVIFNTAKVEEGVGG